MAADIIYSDFGAQENKVCYCFNCFPIYLPLSVWSPDVKNWLNEKDPDAWKDWRQEEKGMTEDEMVGWHHQLNGHEFEQSLGVSDGQESLACCSQWYLKELDMTKRLNWTYGTSCHDLHFLNVEFQASLFTLLFHLHQEALQFFFTLCHKGGIICIFGVIDISPDNLNFSLASSSPAFHMMYSAYKLNMHSDSIQPSGTPFPIWNQSVVPCPELLLLGLHKAFFRRQVRWSGIPISLRIRHVLLWSTQSKVLG